ncbi:MAG: glycosyltransferase family 4 protein [Chloroflexota bacterium]
MRILTLIHEYPPVGGGGGRVARDIAQGLAKRGHEVRILTAHMEGLPISEIANNTKSPGYVQVERISTRRKNAFRAELIEMASYNLAAVNAGQKIIKVWKPDLIHAHFAVPAGAAAFLLSKITGVPYILTAHLGDVPGAVPEKTDRWFKWIYPFTPPIWRGAAGVVAVSEFTRQLALLHYNVPIEVIPNGVELASLPVRLPRKPQDPVMIIFAGRFMDQKNPAHLVQALGQLKDIPWQCAMLGDGPLLENIRSMVAENNLTDRIHLPGWVTPEQVLSEFARSDLLVLPSRSEGLSVVGVQALGMGLAMLLSNAGGNLELVNDNQNGFLFPVGDVNALTDRLRWLLGNPSMLQFAQAQSRELSKKFDLSAIVTQYERIFSKFSTQNKP